MSDNMPRERYEALSRDSGAQLTDEEKAAGWIFCHCEWDGMLIHRSHPEAECCTCLREGKR